MKKTIALASIFSLVLGSSASAAGPRQSVRPSGAVGAINLPVGASGIGRSAPRLAVPSVSGPSLSIPGAASLSGVQPAAIGGASAFVGLPASARMPAAYLPAPIAPQAPISAAADGFAVPMDGRSARALRDIQPEQAGLIDRSAYLFDGLVPLSGDSQLAASAPGAARGKAASMSRPAVIGHRGTAWHAPEETLHSFLLAARLGADYLEMDVHLSKDGVLVVTHDDTFERTTNVAKKFPGREKDPVETFTWDEIQELDAGSSYNAPQGLWVLSQHKPREQFRGAKVLRFEQVLEAARAFPDRKPGVYIEAKYPHDRPEAAVKVADAVHAALVAAGWLGEQAGDKKVVFSSFQVPAVRRFRALAPGVPTALLRGRILKTKEWERALADTADAGADALGPMIFPWQYRKFIQAAKAAGVAVHPWIINDRMLFGLLRIVSGRWLMRMLERAGAESIFTDQVDVAIRAFGGGAVDWAAVWKQVDAKAQELSQYRPKPGHLSEVLSGRVVMRGDPGWNEARRNFNALFDRQPRAVVFVKTPEDVSRSVAWARENGVPIRIRGGRHSYEGYSLVDDGLIIDVSEMKTISYDEKTQLVTVGGGTMAVDLQRDLWKRGRATATSTAPSIGMAGLTLGGGFGILSRKWGATADNLVAAEMVTADGRLIRASADENPDLFWALRGGGGGNFGVVTSLTFRTYPIGKVAFGMMTWNWDQFEAVVDAWQRWNFTAPKGLTTFLRLSTDRTLTLFAQWTPDKEGDLDQMGELLKPLVKAARPNFPVPAGFWGWLLRPLFAVLRRFWIPMYRQVPYSEIIEALANVAEGMNTGTGQQTFKSASSFSKGMLPMEAIKLLKSRLEQAPPNTGVQPNMIQLLGGGGAITEVPPDASAAFYRDAPIVFQFDAYWKAGSDAKAYLDWVGDVRTAMLPYSHGAYVNYHDSQLKNPLRDYYGGNLERLVEVKRQYDPDNVFTYPHGIPTQLPKE